MYIQCVIHLEVFFVLDYIWKEKMGIREQFINPISDEALTSVVTCIDSSLA